MKHTASSSITDNDTFQLDLLIGSGPDDGRSDITGYVICVKKSGIQQSGRYFVQGVTCPIGEHYLVLGSNQGLFPTSFLVAD